MASPRAPITLGRGKLARQAMATTRLGEGLINGFTVRSFLEYRSAPVAVLGNTVKPIPEATICRIVSSELPSTVYTALSCIVADGAQAGQASMTCSRKQ